MTSRRATASEDRDPAPDAVAWWTRESEAALAALETDAEHGLDTAEAVHRRESFGLNQLDSAPPVPAWRRFLSQFADPLIYLLLGAVVVSVIAWAVEGAHGIPIEAVVIAVIVVANAVLGFFQEVRAADAVAALQRMSEVSAGVLRDGQVRRVPATEIVPGDVLVLAEGDAVPADARVLLSASLHVAEAALTGESQPVSKLATVLPEQAQLGDRTNMVFMGTAVTQGTGRAVVTATGMGTEMGHIASMLSRTTKESTPLSREIEGVGRMLGISVIVIALVIMATIALTSGVHSLQDAVDILLVGVSLAVAAVPEGLPAILSVVLSLGVQAMSRRNAIIKSLSSVETLGSASVICSDKTGTLTRNEMTMVRLASRSGIGAVSGTGYAPDGEVLIDGTPLKETDPALPQRREQEVLLTGGSLASDAEVAQDEGVWSVLGDPTEAAFIVAERKAGLDQRRRERFTRVGEVPFSSARKMMSVLVEDSEHPDADGAIRHLLISKGAPDVLLEKCTHQPEGTEHIPLDEAARKQVTQEVTGMYSDALRTLAVAARPLAAQEMEQVRREDGSVDSDAAL